LTPAARFFLGKQAFLIPSFFQYFNIHRAGRYHVLHHRQFLLFFVIQVRLLTPVRFLLKGSGQELVPWHS
jgi:hypothetical protein